MLTDKQLAVLDDDYTLNKNWSEMLRHDLDTDGYVGVGLLEKALADLATSLLARQRDHQHLLRCGKLIRMLLGRKVDRYKLHIPIWLVFSLNTLGNTTLHATTLNPGYARTYRRTLDRGEDAGFHDLVRVWVEPSLANHLFGSTGLVSGWDQSPVKMANSNLPRLRGDALRKKVAGLEEHGFWPPKEAQDATD